MTLRYTVLPDLRYYLTFPWPKVVKCCLCSNENLHTLISHFVWRREGFLHSRATIYWRWLLIVFKISWTIAIFMVCLCYGLLVDMCPHRLYRLAGPTESSVQDFICFNVPRSRDPCSQCNRYPTIRRCLGMTLWQRHGNHAKCVTSHWDEKPFSVCMTTTISFRMTQILPPGIRTYDEAIGIVWPLSS